MDFEQLFDSFPLVPPFVSSMEGLGGGLSGGVEEGGSKEMGMMMSIEDANQIAAAFTAATTTDGNGTSGVDDDMMNNKNQMTGGSDGKMEGELRVTLKRLRQIT
jgi:hypothetical protein